VTRLSFKPYGKDFKVASSKSKVTEQLSGEPGKYLKTSPSEKQLGALIHRSNTKIACKHGRSSSAKSTDVQKLWYGASNVPKEFILPSDQSASPPKNIHNKLVHMLSEKNNVI